MTHAWKPAGYSSVSPYLMVRDAQRVFDFLKRVFDTAELRRYNRPDGSLMHAEVRLDDTVLMFAEATPDWPTVPAWLHVYVSDVDAAYQRALAAGGESVQAPHQAAGEADRRGGVKDPAGNTWWIATQVE